MRGIEFIYREAGVNRPLKPNDDPKENLNRTNYRNQVNKVANAVKEIITAIKKQTLQTGETTGEAVKPEPKRSKKHKLKIIIPSALLFVLIILCYFFIPRLFKPSETTEKSIAVLPFKSLSDDPEKQYLADGVMDAVLLHLQKFKGLKVISRTSIEQYKETTKTVMSLGRNLRLIICLKEVFRRLGIM